MRRVSKLVATSDSEALFLRRVERIAAEKARHPTDYQDYELRAMLRKEEALVKRGNEVQSPTGSQADFIEASVRELLPRRDRFAT